MANILLIESHSLLRLGLCHLIAQSQIPATIRDAAPAELQSGDLVRFADADLLIYGMPPGADLDWAPLESLCKALSPARVLVLSDVACPTGTGAPIPEFVRGFVSKACSSAILDASIRLVLAGGECFPAWTHGDRAALGHNPFVGLVNEPGPSGAWPVSERPRRDGLPFPVIDVETPALGAHMLNITERQYEVLALLARGYPIKTISRLLNISVATAKTHACTLYQRLQVRNKGEAVYEALRRGAKLNWEGPSLPAAAPRHAEPAIRAA